MKTSIFGFSMILLVLKIFASHVLNFWEKQSKTIYFDEALFGIILMIKTLNCSFFYVYQKIETDITTEIDAPITIELISICEFSVANTAEKNLILKIIWTQEDSRRWGIVFAYFGLRKLWALKSLNCIALLLLGKTFSKNEKTQKVLIFVFWFIFNRIIQYLSRQNELIVESAIISLNNIIERV